MTHQTLDPDDLRREIQRLRELIAHNSDWLWEVDAQGRYTFCSEHSREMLGYAPEQILGKTPFDLMVPGEAERVGAIFAGIVAERRSFTGLINRNVRADGVVVVLETSGVPIFDERGELVGYRGIDRNISPSIGSLDSRAVQLEALYAAAPVALALFDREGRFVNANRALARLCECQVEQMTGRALLEFLPAGVIDLEAALARLEAGEGRPEALLEWRGRCYQKTLQAVHDADGQIIGLTLALTDTTEQHRMRQALAESNARLAAANARLSELADTDYLTGLANRRRFDETLLSETGRALREQRPLALLMLDVDQFKPFNDHYGHQAGDACMRRLAQILRQQLLRPGDLLARYGGEEFAAILAMTGGEDAEHVAQRMRQAVYDAALEHAACASGRVTVSIGIGCLVPSQVHGEPPLEVAASRLLKAADDSLYAAKRGGRNRVHKLPS